MIKDTSSDRRVATTSILLWGDRNAPASTVRDQAKAISDSGAVDYLSMSDQLLNFVPPSLWTPEITPMAEVVPDPDSLSDPFVMASYALSATSDMGIAILTDSIRHGPAQLIHMMMTIANITEGRAAFLIGAGEVKQCKPFGWKRSRGLARMEDLYRAFHAMWNTDGPVSFEGNDWVFQNAYMGSAKVYRPEILGLGGGPKLLDLATTYADGFSAAAPCVWPTPDDCAVHIEQLKHDLASKGRDPEAYRYGIFCPVLIHEDPAVLERALENKLVRWIAAIFGRINPKDWELSGLPSPVPEGWTYYLKMLPHSTPASFVDEVTEKAGREYAEKGYIWGSPAEVAAQLQAYVDVGVNWVAPVDYMPMVSDVEDGAKSLARTIDVCRYLKGMPVS